MELTEKEIEKLNNEFDNSKLMKAIKKVVKELKYENHTTNK